MRFSNNQDVMRMQPTGGKVEVQEAEGLFISGISKTDMGNHLIVNEQMIKFCLRIIDWK